MHLFTQDSPLLLNELKKKAEYMKAEGPLIFYAYSDKRGQVFQNDYLLLFYIVNHVSAMKIHRSRARGHAHRARLDAEILYIDLRASLTWKSKPRTMSRTSRASWGPLPLGAPGI